MDFLTWCQKSRRWWFASWANDKRCRLPKDVPESREAYAERFTAAGYAGYLHRLAESDSPSSAWGEYVRSTGGPS